MKKNKDKKKKSLKEFSNIFKIIKKDKKKFILGFIFIFISSLLSIPLGYLQGKIIETIVAVKINKALLYLGGYFLASGILENIFRNLGVLITRRIESNLSKKLSIMVYKKMLNLPAYAFEEKSSGELINRIVIDTESLSNSFNSILGMCIDVFCCILILIYIIFNSYIVAIEIVIFLIIIAIITKIYSPKMKKVYDELKKEKDDFAAISTESIRGVREIKTLGIKSNLINHVSEIRENVYNKDLKDVSIHRQYTTIMWALRSLFEVTVYATCLLGIYYKFSTLGFFMAMTWYVYRYTWLVQNLSEMNVMYQKMFVSVRRINEVINNTLYEDEKFGNVNLRRPKGDITFKNVVFGYPNEDVILNNFSTTFETNKKIAVVGKSGQGKSTLFNLITRIFNPKEGSIYLDDVDIKDLTEESLRRNVSVIRQEPFLFNKTIKENFKMVKPNITLKEIKKYCKMAYLDDYIESLPNGYNTLLGEGGVNLSGGQKQRLSIARALAKESKVILFDEATSALDNQSQSYIKKVIDDLVKEHTIIIIAHRLSTIVDSDIIYVVDKGKVVAKGKHEELLEKSEVYKTLYENEDEM